MLDDRELETIFEPLNNAGIVNMEMLTKMDMPTVLNVCGLYRADSGLRPRLTRAQEATLKLLTAATLPALAKATRPTAPPAAVTPKLPSAKRQVPIPAPPAAARPSHVTTHESASSAGTAFIAASTSGSILKRLEAIGTPGPRGEADVWAHVTARADGARCDRCGEAPRPQRARGALSRSRTSRSGSRSRARTQGP